MSDAFAARPRSEPANALLTIAGIAAAAGVALVLQRGLGVERQSGVYFIAVIICAAAFGVWQGLLGAIVATVAFDATSEGRSLTLSFGDKQDFLNLALFSAGAWVVSLYVEEARRERQALVRLTQAELAADAGPILARVIEFTFFRWRALGEALKVLAAIVLAVAAVGVGSLILEAIGPPLVSTIYLAGVVVAATLLGPRYALITAILNVIAYDYYVLAPRFSPALGSATAGVALVVFLAVGWQVGRFTEQVRYDRRVVRRLFEAGGSFSATADEPTLRRLLAEAISGVTGGRRVVVLDECGAVVAECGEKRTIAAVPPRTLRRGAEFDGERTARLASQGRDFGQVVWTSRPTDEDRPTEHTVAALLNLGAAAIARARIAGKNAELEATAQAEDLRRALLASVSHDFRTPLAGILGSVTGLVDLYDQYDDASRRDLLLNIRQQAFRLSRYVENLLGMSRVESRSLQPKVRPIALESLVYDTWESIAEGMHGARPVIAVPDDLWVEADPVLLRHAFANVLENAIKYSPPGRPVRVSASETDGKATLRVVDFGPGAPGEDLDQLFKPFVRARKSRAGGIGLGLFIARSFMEAMGGTVTATSRQGEETGMVVELTLPTAGGDS